MIQKIGLFTCLMFLGMTLFAQNSILGTIYDTSGEPLPGANIMIQEQNQGAISDSDGFFRFANLPKGEYTLMISYIGYKSITEMVDLSQGNAEVEFTLQPTSYQTEVVEVRGTWAEKDDPFTQTNLDKEDLERLNLGQDAPFIFRYTPSTVVTSDAGTGIGYTGLRIRGSDITRINVTINGIPLNDSESQGVFWVNMPDFISSTDEVQIQRGVGTSTNGAGAFGATINLGTNAVKADPFVTAAISGGSFNTQRYSLRGGTGIIGDHFTVDGRLSYITSDGYIDRGSADLYAGYLSAAYLGDHQSLRLNVFTGSEVTYQAWNGVPFQYVAIDSLRTFNTAGQDQTPEPYDNEVDDYNQTHVQLHYNFNLQSDWQGKVSGHYTRGAGFFENYSAEETLADFGIPGGGVSDLVTRRWLDNHFYGVISAFEYVPSDRPYTLTLGGGVNRYTNRHFGEVIFIETQQDLEEVPVYYDNDATKMDGNIYAKLDYQLSPKWTAFGDLQYRHVDYAFEGLNEDGNPTDQDVQLNFFNPKVGVTYQMEPRVQWYASFAVGNHEPNRNDFVISTPSSRPEHETLYNTEVGYRYNGKRASIEANFFHMYYQNQLVLTGEINNVGEAIRTNVDNSYRAGLELAAGAKLHDRVEIGGTATFSQNKIREFTEFVDNWDYFEGSEDPQQFETLHEDTDLSFSPRVITSGEITVTPFRKEMEDGMQQLQVTLLGKYIGSQFIDNTQDEFRKLNAYGFFDLRLGYQFKNSRFKFLEATLLVQNLLDDRFSTNAWVYPFRSAGYNPIPDDPYARSEGGTRYNLTGLYPQALRSFLVGLKVGF